MMFEEEEGSAQCSVWVDRRLWTARLLQVASQNFVNIDVEIIAELYPAPAATRHQALKQ